MGSRHSVAQVLPNAAGCWPAVEQQATLPERDVTVVSTNDRDAAACCRVVRSIEQFYLLLDSSQEYTDKYVSGMLSYHIF